MILLGPSTPIEENMTMWFTLRNNKPNRWKCVTREHSESDHSVSVWFSVVRNKLRKFSVDW
mgnify:CR=1 FL=1